MKKRFFALFLAALMLLFLFPAGTLAAMSFIGNTNPLCSDGDCAVLGCTGPDDPNHGARGPDDMGPMTLNLSSEGRNKTLAIPAKSNMTINDIPWFPNYGQKGHALINVKELLAVKKAQALLEAEPTLNANELLLYRERLYINDAGIAKLSEAAANDASRQYWHDANGKRECENFGFLQLRQNLPFFSNSTFDVEGEEFVIAVGGKKFADMKVANVWQDKKVPFFDPDYANDPGSPNDARTECPNCRGRGIVDTMSSAPATCTTCGGSGYV